MRVFGFEINRAENQKEEIRSFVAPPNEDGAIEIAPVGGVFGTYLDLTGQAKDEAELVTKYRAMERDATVRKAIEDVVNEAIIISEDEKPVRIDLEDVGLSDQIKQRIEDEFDEIMRLLDFSNKGYDIFQRWYVDGRLRFHMMIDENQPEAGIKEMRYIDPRKIKKIREIVRKKFGNDIEGSEKEVKNEYYVYSERGFSKTMKSGDAFGPMNNDIKGIRIAKDSVIDINSGLFSEDNALVLSFLDSAAKPLNQLQMLENASVIYRLARAPERRVFYLDVGDLPKAKAEQYLNDMMARHKNKLVYDPATGEIKDDRRFMTMLEDYWLPRREGGRGTEITTLPGAANLGEMDDIKYFQGKLYEALNVPSSRLQSDGIYSLGKSSEISRDEVKFAKFINRLRNKFNALFDEALEKQLILKRILTYEDWSTIKNSIRYNYLEDNHYQELARIEILNNRLLALRNIQDYVGIYYSRDWVRRNVLFQLDDEIKDIDNQMNNEIVTHPAQPVDGDNNNDGFPDRQGKALLNAYKEGAINIEYVHEPSLEENIDNFLKTKLNIKETVSEENMDEFITKKLKFK